MLLKPLNKVDTKITRKLKVLSIFKISLMSQCGQVRLPSPSLRQGVRKNKVHTHHTYPSCRGKEETTTSGPPYNMGPH